MQPSTIVIRFAGGDALWRVSRPAFVFIDKKLAKLRILSI